MNPMWMATRYLLDLAYCRARAARDGKSESGALSLEWILIAVALVGGAAIAAAAITAAIRSQVGGLP